jgi:hypothetical protein
VKKKVDEKPKPVKRGKVAKDPNKPKRPSAYLGTVDNMLIYLIIYY